MEILLKRRMINMSVQIKVVQIEDVVFKIATDDDNVVTDISIKHGSKEIIFSKNPPLSNINEGIKLLRKISSVDRIDEIKRIITDYIDNSFNNTNNFLTIHPEDYDPDYFDILKEKEEDKKRK